VRLQALDGILVAMKIVLISTYELGRQPFGVVSPAAWLRSVGHQVACFDFDPPRIGCGDDWCGGVDRDLFADAYGYEAGGEIDSLAAAAESRSTCLLLWPVCADECEVFAWLGEW